MFLDRNIYSGMIEVFSIMSKFSEQTFSRTNGDGIVVQ